MKSFTATLLAVVATTLTLKGVAAVALPGPQAVQELPDGQIGYSGKRAAAALAEPQTVTFSDGDSIHFAGGKRGETAPVLTRIAAPEFVKRHPKDIGIFAKAEDIEDCPAPCDFYIRSVEEPVKREVELVKESEDIEDCPAPCDFYIRSVDEPEPAKREVELVKESEDLEDCAAPCDFYIRSEESANILIHPLPVGPAEGPTLPEKRDAELVKESEDVEDCAAPCDFYIRSVDEEDVAAVADGDLDNLWLAKKSDDVADGEECAAPCDFYIH